MRGIPKTLVGCLVAALAAAGVIALAGCARPAPDRAVAPSGERDGGRTGDAAAPLPDAQNATDPAPLPDVLIDPEVRVEKQARRLTVLSAGEAVKRYRIALGRVPVGDKEREGDGRTPEGEFYVCSKNAESRYHRALGLSYPSDEDAERGLAEKLITAREHRAIVSAIRRMQRPPWNTALGGEIMIHGAGSGRGDWTLGCIALDDADAEELFNALPLGTPVRVLP